MGAASRSRAICTSAGHPRVIPKKSSISDEPSARPSRVRNSDRLKARSCAVTSATSPRTPRRASGNLGIRLKAPAILRLSGAVRNNSTSRSVKTGSAGSSISSRISTVQPDRAHTASSMDLTLKVERSSRPSAVARSAHASAMSAQDCGKVSQPQCATPPGKISPKASGLEQIRS